MEIGLADEESPERRSLFVVDSVPDSVSLGETTLPAGGVTGRAVVDEASSPNKRKDVVGEDGSEVLQALCCI